MGKLRGVHGEHATIDFAQEIRAMKLALTVMALLASGCLLASDGFAQASPPIDKPSAGAKNQENAQGLSHDLSGVWMQYRDGDVPGTPGMNGVNEHFRPPLTPWGEDQFKNAHALQGNAAIAGKEDNSALRCEPSGPPQVLILPNPWEIVQIPGRVLMFFEEQHIWREIWTDGRPLPKDPDPSWLGYSVGHWEGDTFIVETAGFNDKTPLDRQGRPHSEALKVVERYRRRDFGHLDVESTFDDPKFYTRPFTIKVPHDLLPDGDIFESYCTDNEKDRAHLGKR